MSQLTEEEGMKLKEIYDQLSGEESGGLKVDQLLHMAQIFGLNLSRSEVQEKLTEFDSDQDGDLDFQELRKLVEYMYRTKEERRDDITDAVKVILSSFELNEDEYLTKEQFEQFLMNKGDDPLTQEEINEIFTSLDKDGDDKISAWEIADLLEKDNIETE